MQRVKEKGVYISSELSGSKEFVTITDKETGEIEEKKYRIKDTDTADFWKSILTQKSFYDYVKGKYMMASTDIMNNKDLEIDLSELDNE